MSIRTAPCRPSRPRTTAIVLCGGRGSRFGGLDKPLLALAGKPLVAHVVDRIAPQVDDIVLACGASARGYRRFGHRVVRDLRPGQGPLAGFCAALRHASTPWVLLAPGDAPFLPADLVAAMAPFCSAHGAAAASADGRRQNLALLLDQPRAGSLAAFFVAGGRAARQWLDERRVACVEFDAGAFLNVNAPADLATAERQLAGVGLTSRAASRE